MATVRFRRGSRALYTSPIAPAPICDSMTYGPSRVPAESAMRSQLTTGGEQPANWSVPEEEWRHAERDAAQEQQPHIVRGVRVNNEEGAAHHRRHFPLLLAVDEVAAADEAGNRPN